MLRMMMNRAEDRMTVETLTSVGSWQSMLNEHGRPVDWRGEAEDMRSQSEGEEMHKRLLRADAAFASIRIGGRKV